MVKRATLIVTQDPFAEHRSNRLRELLDDRCGRLETGGDRRRLLRDPTGGVGVLGGDRIVRIGICDRQGIATIHDPRLNPPGPHDGSGPDRD